MQSWLRRDVWPIGTGEDAVGKVDLDEILRRACRRDPEALGLLVELYGHRVFGLLYELSGSRETAEELLQETFLRVVRTIDRYVHSGKFEAWLFRIAANLARDRARQSRRRGIPVSLESGPVQGEALVAREEFGSASVPERRAMDKESLERLSRCLERLTPPQREILLLRHYSGLSFPEIAQLLGVPLGTALARAHRALQRLKADFTGQT